MERARRDAANPMRVIMDAARLDRRRTVERTPVGTSSTATGGAAAAAAAGAAGGAPGSPGTAAAATATPAARVTPAERVAERAALSRSLGRDLPAAVAGSDAESSQRRAEVGGGAEAAAPVSGPAWAGASNPETLAGSSGPTAGATSAVSSAATPAGTAGVTPAGTAGVTAGVTAANSAATASRSGTDAALLPAAAPGPAASLPAALPAPLSVDGAGPDTVAAGAASRTVRSTGPAALAARPANPVLLQMVEPIIPQQLRSRVGGLRDVLAELRLRPDGSVASVELVSSTPRLLHRYITDALAQWRFAPLPEERLHRVQLVFDGD